MSNAVAKLPTATLPAFAMQEAELINVLCSSLYPGASEPSVKMVLGYCKAAGLDPMQKPVHIVPMWDKNTKSMRDVIMPGIGLYRTQAARSGEYSGVSEPEFGPTVQTEVGGVKMAYPEWCRVTVKREVGGKERAYTAREYWLENYATKEKDSAAPNAMWRKRPFGQLAKCAEAQALRKAFPEFGAAPTADEMEGAIDIGDPQPPHPPVDMPRAKAADVTPAAKVIDAEVIVPEAKPAPAESKPAASETPATNGETKPAITESMKRVLVAKLAGAGKTDVDLCAAFGIASLEALTVDRMNDALAWVTQ